MKSGHVHTASTFFEIVSCGRASILRASSAYFVGPHAPQNCNSRWGEPVGDFVAAVKAHARLRCATEMDGRTGVVKEFDEEKYAKMAYWVCASAPKSALRSQTQKLLEVALELSPVELHVELYLEFGTNVHVS